MRLRHTLVVLISTIAAGVGAGAALAASPAPPGARLGGEVFNGNALTSNKQCDVDGTSSFDFTSQGVATGVYPGTYTESGTITIGPQTRPGFPAGIRYGFNAGTVIDIDFDFTIDSPLAQVSGHKSIVAVVPENAAACAQLAEYDLGPALPQDFGICTDVDFQDAWLPLLHYDATIVTPTATYSDSGEAVARLFQLQAFCPALVGPDGQGGFIRGDGVFEEAFYYSGPIDTPGHATGGGMIDRVPGQPGVTFGFNVDSTGSTFKGNCTVVDHTLGTHVKCLDVTSYIEVGNQATFRGHAEVDGVPTSYRIDVTDNGEPGTGTDTFAISTDSGYAAVGTVTGGNVQIH